MVISPGLEAGETQGLIRSILHTDKFGTGLEHYTADELIEELLLRQSFRGIVVCILPHKQSKPTQESTALMKVSKLHSDEIRQVLQQLLDKIK